MGEKIIVHKTFIWNDFASVSFSSLYTPGMKSTSYYHHMKISLLIMFCEHLLMLLPKVASCSFDLSAYRHLFAKPTNLVIISLWLCMISLWYIIANEWVTPNTKTPKTGGKSDNTKSDFLKIARLRSSMHLDLCKWRTETKSRRVLLFFWLFVFFSSKTKTCLTSHPFFCFLLLSGLHRAQTISLASGAVALVRSQCTKPLSIRNKQRAVSSSMNKSACEDGDSLRNH